MYFEGASSPPQTGDHPQEKRLHILRKVAAELVFVTDEEYERTIDELNNLRDRLEDARNRFLDGNEHDRHRLTIELTNALSIYATAINDMVRFTAIRDFQIANEGLLTQEDYLQTK